MLSSHLIHRRMPAALTYPQPPECLYAPEMSGSGKPRRNVLQLDTVRVDPAVAARAGALDRDDHAVAIAAHRHPANLHVAEEHHAGRAPVLERVREDVRIHERAPRLPRAECPELAVRVAQAERRLSFVDAGAEQLELERRLEITERGRRRGLHAEPALAHAGERAVVLAELLLEGRKLGDTHRIEPVRVDLLEVVADVEHGEAVDLEAAGLSCGAARLDTAAEHQERRHQPERRPGDRPYVVAHRIPSPRHS